MGLAEQLGDLYCKVGSFPKALEAYRTQVRETRTSRFKTVPSEFLVSKRNHVVVC